jgi:hypothetical protein
MCRSAPCYQRNAPVLVQNAHTCKKEKTASWLNTVSCSTINKRRKTCNGIGMLGLATLCCHSVSETFRWNDGKRLRRLKNVLSLDSVRKKVGYVSRYYSYNCNAIAIAIYYLIPSLLLRFPYLHTCIPFTSRCLCITHSARHFNAQLSPAASRI